MSFDQALATVARLQENLTANYHAMRPYVHSDVLHSYMYATHACIYGLFDVMIHEVSWADEGVAGVSIPGGPDEWGLGYCGWDVWLGDVQNFWNTHLAPAFKDQGDDVELNNYRLLLEALPEQIDYMARMCTTELPSALKDAPRQHLHG